MAGFSNIYNTQTVRIMSELYSSKYDDPFELRAALERCELYSFGQELWQATLTRYPCELYIKVLAECESIKERAGDLSQAKSLFARNKQALWSDYCAGSTAGDTSNIVAFVSSFFRNTCRSNPMCRPCSCKKHLTDFFEQISGEGHENVKKNINNWISGHSSPNTREGYIQLCYALGLRIFHGSSVNMLDANRFLSFCCGQNPLYIRNAQEAVHYFCLMRPFGRELPAEEDYDNVGNYKYSRSLMSRLNEHSSVPVQSDGYTIESKLMINGIKSEADLIGYISSHAENKSERYYSAKKLLERFCEEYKLLEFEPEDYDAPKKKRLTKGMALQVVDIFANARTDKGSVKMLRDFVSAGYSLSDALFCSDIVTEMVDGLQVVSRSIVLLTALSLNYGTAYDVRSGRMRDTREFDECTSFFSFCSTLSAILESCNMATLYPRRKFDFLVLHSYMCMSRDVNRNGIAGALSDYLLKAMEIMGKCEE